MQGVFFIVGELGDVSFTIAGVIGVRLFQNVGVKREEEKDKQTLIEAILKLALRNRRISNNSARFPGQPALA